jgi:hypothetical protein
MPQYGQIDKHAIPKGYVNATQMARANRKLLSDYIRLKSTKDYLQALGNDMGIPISSLIIEIEGDGKEQGTWVHPEIAIDLAQWVSVSFRIWANMVSVPSAVHPLTETTPQECIGIVNAVGWMIQFKMFVLSYFLALNAC